MLARGWRGGEGTPGNSWWGCAARFFKSWPDFGPKNVIFNTRIRIRSLKSKPVFRPALSAEIMLSLLRLECKPKIALRADSKNTLQLMRPSTWLRQTLLLTQNLCMRVYRVLSKTLIFSRIFQDMVNNKRCSCEQCKRDSRTWEILKESEERCVLWQWSPGRETWKR